MQYEGPIHQTKFRTNALFTENILAFLPFFTLRRVATAVPRRDYGETHKCLGEGRTTNQLRNKRLKLRALGQLTVPFTSIGSETIVNETTHDGKA